MLSSWCLGSRRLVVAVALCASGCVTTSERVTYQSARQEPPSGFFDRMMDSVSARECNVRRFTCEYGIGAAGEPCECVGPNNQVFSGRTVK